jgi:hypothetical protein
VSDDKRDGVVRKERDGVSGEKRNGVVRKEMEW